ncbi:MAG: CdaR family protein [Acidobacteriota bacterium]
MLVGNSKTPPPPRWLFVKHIIRKIFLEDWLMKLVALAITIALWLGVTVFTKQGTGRFTVPLNFRVSDNSILTGSAVKDVAIRVRGDDQKIRDLSPNDIRISLDLGDVDPGEKIITIDPSSVASNLPVGIKLEDIQPRGIPVKLEAAEQKDVPVRADIQGEPAKGFEVYPNESIAPQRIRVRGPASYIRPLDYLLTEKIDTTGKREDFVAKQIPIKITSDNTTVSDPVVTVSIHIGEKRVERTFLVSVSGSTTKKATVLLYGPPAMFLGLRPENLKVEIIKDADGPESARVILPDALDGNVEVRSIKVRP